MINKKILLGLWAAFVCASQNQQQTPEERFLQSLSASMEATNKQAVLIQEQKKAREKMETTQMQAHDFILKEESTMWQFLWDQCLAACRTDLCNKSILGKIEILNEEEENYKKLRYLYQTETNEWRNLTPELREKYIVPNNFVGDASTLLFQTGGENGVLRTVKVDRALAQKYMRFVRGLLNEDDSTNRLTFGDMATPLPLILVLECLEAFEKGSPLPKRSYISYNTMDVFFYLVIDSLELKNAFIDATGSEFLSEYFFGNVIRGFFTNYTPFENYFKRCPDLVLNIYAQFKRNKIENILLSCVFDAFFLCNAFSDTYISKFVYSNLDLDLDKMIVYSTERQYSTLRQLSTFQLNCVILTENSKNFNLCCDKILIHDSFIDSLRNFFSNISDLKYFIGKTNARLFVSSEEHKDYILSQFKPYERVQVDLFTEEDREILAMIPIR